MRDANKHVQEAACSALATLEEAAGRELLESSRITAILKTLAAALQVLCARPLAPVQLSYCGIVLGYTVCLLLCCTVRQVWCRTASSRGRTCLLSVTSALMEWAGGCRCMGGKI